MRALCIGTPFNNGPQDMAAMMSYVNPLAHESSLSFWKEATSENPRDTVVKKLRCICTLVIAQRNKLLRTRTKHAHNVLLQCEKQYKYT
jgi:hypothetical protein